MKIWVDADACPKAIRTIIFRAANRTKIVCIFVSNHLLALPQSAFIRRVVVQQGFDVADEYIVVHTEPDDLVITSDIPLANAAIKKGAQALSHRGAHYTKHNIDEHMATRNLMSSLRDNGIVSGGPSSLTNKQLQCFANCLDKIITQSSI